MNPQKHIIIIVNTSQSSIRYLNDIVASLNILFGTLKIRRGYVFVTLCWFTHDFGYVFSTKYVGDLPVLDAGNFSSGNMQIADYIPGKDRALFDTVASMINYWLQNQVSENIVFILSDWVDTASREHTSISTSNSINLAKSSGWKILVIPPSTITNPNILVSEYNKLRNEDVLSSQFSGMNIQIPANDIAGDIPDLSNWKI